MQGRDDMLHRLAVSQIRPDMANASLPGGVHMSVFGFTFKQRSHRAVAYLDTEHTHACYHGTANLTRQQNGTHPLTGQKGAIGLSYNSEQCGTSGSGN